MIRVRCGDCDGQFSMNETIKVWERELCKACAQRILQSDAYVSEDAVQLQIDPAVCRNCGRDNGARPLEMLAFSFYFNARFFLAYREMKVAFRSEDFRQAPARSTI